MKIAILSFDVEEFDMPFEYGGNPSMEEQIETSRLGLEKLIPMLKKYNAKSTIYCTGVYANAQPETIKEISNFHEIASHNYYHSSHKTEDLITSKKTLENIIQKKVEGFRMPRMAPVLDQDLINAGYSYNASVNPTYIPGRYDKRDVSRTFFTQNELLQFPASVSPKYRIPLFWISFHNFPLWFFFYLCKRVVQKDGYLHLYFHPWEFTNYTKANNGSKYPFYLKRNNGEKMIKRFEKLLIYLQKEGYDFQTTGMFLKDKK
jgi:peptidoglycan/xylan/chitin deacetylase (PgdA/CDA1 family)